MYNIGFHRIFYTIRWMDVCWNFAVVPMYAMANTHPYKQHYLDVVNCLWIGALCPYLNK